jgi:hypothetical protein
VSSVVAQEPLPEALSPIKGFMFDLDGRLLLSDRALGGYEVLPGAIEVLSVRLWKSSWRAAVEQQPSE